MIPVKIKEVKIKDVIALCEAGVTRKEIGEKYELRAMDLKRLFMHPKLAAYKNKKSYAEFKDVITEDKVIELMGTGMTRTEIATHMKIPVGAIRLFFKENEHLKYMKPKKKPGFIIVDEEETAEAEVPERTDEETSVVSFVKSSVLPTPVTTFVPVPSKTETETKEQLKEPEPITVKAAVKKQDDDIWRN